MSHEDSEVSFTRREQEILQEVFDSERIADLLERYSSKYLKGLLDKLGTEYDESLFAPSEEDLPEEDTALVDDA